MSYDNMTISALAVIAVLIVVIILLRRSKAKTESTMRELVWQLLALHSSEAAMRLCKKIHERYPDLCAGIDFTVIDEDGHARVDKWNSDKPRPEE